MKQKCFIVDTTLRDGEQSPNIALTIEQKVIIAQLIEEAGVYQIEAGIPAMGDCEITAIREIMKNRKSARIAVWARLNIEDIKKCGMCEPDIIHISLPVSYAQIYSKLNKNKAWIIKNLNTCIRQAQCYNSEITIGFEDASRADISFLIHLCNTVRELGINRIRFSDTVGVLIPSKCSQYINDIIKTTGIEVEFHAHNDYGLACANSVEAAKSGAKYVDTTILGIGERAGNCNMTKLIHASEQIIDWNVNKLAAQLLEEGFKSVIKKL